MTSNDTEPRRRSLIRGVAWAAPTMAAAVAAPAIAVSTPCAETDVTLNCGMSAYSGTPSATSTFTTNVRFNPTASSTNNPDLNNPMTATIVHRWFGNARGDGPNGTISTFNVGGTNQVGYYLRQQVGPNGATAPTTADYQTIQVTFSEVVRNLRFSITDIDRVWAPGAYDFIDGVSLTSSSPFTSRAPSGSTVTGAGTSSSPWRNSQDGNKSEDGPGGQIDITFAQPVQSFTLRYDNLGRTVPTSGLSNNQAVFLTRFITNRPAQCAS